MSSNLWCQLQAIKVTIHIILYIQNKFLFQFHNPKKKRKEENLEIKSMYYLLGILTLIPTNIQI